MAALIADSQMFQRDKNYSELRADGGALRKNAHHLAGHSRGGNIVIGGITTEQQVSHTAAHPQGLVTPLAENAKRLQCGLAGG